MSDNKIVIEKCEFLDALGEDIVKEVGYDFFDWLHGSGCDAVEDKFFTPLRKLIFDRIKEDKEFVEGIKKEIAQGMITDDLLDDVYEQVKHDVKERMTELMMKQMATKLGE